MNREIEKILSYLNEKRGFDFAGNRPAMIERRISKRLLAVNRADFSEYLNYLEECPEELNNLIDVLTINVSRFFRETLTFEFVADIVLPDIAAQKRATADDSLKVWSAGCATGEEPYSVSILINELMKKETPNLNINIFATDINETTLKKAQDGVYPFESIKGIKYGLLKKYFTMDNEKYMLCPEIKNSVNFSIYDMLDKKTYAPPESVFGNFDLILCRNVLIYFQAGYQEIIFDKLLRALAKNGYLILGEAEILPPKYQQHFQKVNACCHIYRKRQSQKVEQVFSTA